MITVNQFYFFYNTVLVIFSRNGKDYETELYQLSDLENWVKDYRLEVVNHIIHLDEPKETVYKIPLEIYMAQCLSVEDVAEFVRMKIK